LPRFHSSCYSTVSWSQPQHVNSSLWKRQQIALYRSVALQKNRCTGVGWFKNFRVTYFQLDYNIKCHGVIKHRQSEKYITTSHIFWNYSKAVSWSEQILVFCRFKNFIYSFTLFPIKELVLKGWNLLKHIFSNACNFITDCTWIYRAMGGLCQPHRYSEDLWLAAFRLINDNHLFDTRILWKKILLAGLCSKLKLYWRHLPLFSSSDIFFHRFISVKLEVSCSKALHFAQWGLLFAHCQCPRVQNVCWLLSSTVLLLKIRLIKCTGTL
jgi:hypothetical protein